LRRADRYLARFDHPVGRRDTLDEEQVGDLRELLFDESRSEAKADCAAADFRKSSVAGACGSIANTLASTRKEASGFLRHA
jgi:hypothetical protein